jgi:excisionase family DNA binding protein
MSKKHKMAKKVTYNNLPEAVARLLDEVAEIKELIKKELKKEVRARAEKGIEAKHSVSEIEIEKVCELLNRSKQTVYSSVKSGELTARKQGRRLIFDKEQVLAYAGQRTEKPRGRKKKTLAASIVRKPRRKRNENQAAENPVESSPKG